MTLKGLEKLQKRNRLGNPPSIGEASSNLNAPEVAPTNSEILNIKKVDGRKLRASGRTIQFATRVSEDFDLKIRAIAAQKKMLLVEVLEAALSEYEKNN